MSITLEDAKTLAATFGSVLVAAGSFFLWLTRLIIQQAITSADQRIYDKIDELRAYVDGKFVTADTLDQLSKRVDDLHG